MIEPVQFLAGERLRADFTFAQLMPRMTVDWASPIAGGSGAAAGGPAAMAETVVAARQRLKHALDAAGPEFAGLLVDVCCFLKGIEDVERERGWPPRSAKIVLQSAGPALRGRCGSAWARPGAGAHLACARRAFRERGRGCHRLKWWRSMATGTALRGCGQSGQAIT